MARTKLSQPVKRDPLAKAADTKTTKATTQVVSLKQRKGDRKRRWRPGTVALRQIREQQKSIKLALPRTTFKTLVQEVAQKMALNGNVRIAKSAYPMLQAAGEDYIIDLFKGAQIRAIDQGKVTVTDKHLRREARAEDLVRTRLLATATQIPLG